MTRVGFLGVGWIGRHRMQAMIETGAVEAAGERFDSGADRLLDTAEVLDRIYGR